MGLQKLADEKTKKCNSYVTHCSDGARRWLGLAWLFDFISNRQTDRRPVCCTAKILWWTNSTVYCFWPLTWHLGNNNTDNDTMQMRFIVCHWWGMCRPGTRWTLHSGAVNFNVIVWIRIFKWCDGKSILDASSLCGWSHRRMAKRPDSSSCGVEYRMYSHYFNVKCLKVNGTHAQIPERRHWISI